MNPGCPSKEPRCPNKQHEAQRHSYRKINYGKKNVQPFILDLYTTYSQ